ncbi:hypothetical protein BBJ28_00016234 [Nothophytophthora sp. Chile5]|nr:hypothetical protein BBJ28_00016234 [Nothophytophthora sp. Chile5]
MKRSSARLHNDDARERPTVTSTASVSVPNSREDDGPPPPPLPLSISLHGLVAEAEAQHDRVDFGALVEMAESPTLPLAGRGNQRWKRVESSTAFSLFKRDGEVLALSRVQASVEEVASILGATTDTTHAAAMGGLYSKAFIAGSVAYVERPQTSGTTEQVHQHLAVKTSSFVHSDLLGKNEQWCFAELFRRKPELDGFMITQGSLLARQARLLPARLAIQDSTRRVAQLRGVTAAYLVERLPRNRGLRIVFHARFNPNEDEAGVDEGRGGLEEVNVPIVSRKVARTRLLLLARGISRLSELVSRRRFGAQVLADRSAFDVRNPRCTCCTRRLLPFLSFVAKTRCYLCGYYVCGICSSSEKMETHNGRLASIVVCTRCRESVAACDYENMMTVSSTPARVVSAPPPRGHVPLSRISQQLTASSPSSFSHASPVSSRLSSFSSISTVSSSNQLLVDLLEHANDDDVSSARRLAAVTVLEQLLLADQEETQIQADENAKVLRAAVKPAQVVAFLDTLKTATHAPSSLCIEAATLALDVSHCSMDLADCQLANAESRSYPMLPALPAKESSSPAQPILYPIPANESARLAAIERLRLHDAANIRELNVICSLAAAEMHCPHSVLTLVEREEVTLLAANSAENWDVGSGNPREQTFCQHFVMDDRPLLVRHAEADVRFYHIAPVVQRSLRFYSGFPVSVTVAPTGKGGEPTTIVVGALCCLDEQPHEMTRSQYWRLMKLACAASQILEGHALQLLQASSYARISPSAVGAVAS